MKAQSFPRFGFISLLAIAMAYCTHVSAAPPGPFDAATLKAIKMAAALNTTPKTGPQSDPEAPPKITGNKDVCLECHGPFADLAGASITFTAENGDKINPHRYVPHNRKDSKGIVECTKCHKPHPVPPESKSGLPKANANWCYSCHHTQEFQPCSSCHH
jgi:predicted CXXCH cytochrome family protein